MALRRITYDNKSNPVPVVNRSQQATAEDFQDIKDTLNENADELDVVLTPFDFTFENDDLVDGVYSVTHGKNTEFPKLTLKRPDGSFEETTQIMKYIDANNVNLDFGGEIDAGTWTGRITYQ